MQRRFLTLSICALLGLGACAGTPEEPFVPPERQVSDVTREGEEFAIQVYDPIEGFNRGVYNFNAEFDRWVFIPVVNAYRFVTPEFVRNRIHDFFSNITELTTFANSLLQAKAETAGRAATRFIVNTMFTLGFYDLAGAKGVAQQKEDFGQTLGVWGAGEGPYLVLPILGPSNLRDATGLAVDNAPFFVLIPPSVSTSIAYRTTAYGLQPIDKRNSIAFRYYETGSPFEYDLVRLLYTKWRQLEIEK
jgi:phospholipid-binding lipoprotein MlaA